MKEMRYRGGGVMEGKEQRRKNKVKKKKRKRRRGRRKGVQEGRTPQDQGKSQLWHSPAAPHH